MLCEKCNNSKTQASDLAWGKLSKFLSDNWVEIKKLKMISLYDVFGDEWEKKMILVQLYFTKIFGCKIAESNAPIDLHMFSLSILNIMEHPSLHISFRDSEKKTNYACLSDIEIYSKNKDIVYAHLFYTVGNITIDILYYEQGIEAINLNGALKPSCMKQNLQLSELNYDQEYGE